MKKKILILAMFILLMLAAIPSAMAACSHTFQWVTRNPTCTSNGAKEFKCSKCGVVATSQTLYATGHNFVLKSTTKAKCKVNGSKYYKCSKCPATKTETIKALGHDLYTPKYTKPNCKRGSIKITLCSRCDYRKEETLPRDPNHHSAMSYVYVYHERCETAGKKEYKCGNCGYVDKTKDKTINATGHNYVDDAVQNSYDCDEVKYKTQTCTHDLCEKKHRTVKVRDPIPHKETTDMVFATQNKHGSKTTYCTVCRKILKIETLHSYKMVNPLKCDEAGDIQFKCTVSGCQDMYSIFHQAGPHDWGEWHYGMRECKKCSATEGY